MSIRPMRSRRKNDMIDKGKLEAAFAAGVKARDEYRCRFERWVGGQWVEHGIKGSPLNPLFAAHIYDRDDCGTAKFDLEVALTSCLDCHNRYDLRTYRGPAVRVPLDREAVAYKHASEAITTFRVVRRLPPERPDNV